MSLSMNLLREFDLILAVKGAEYNTIHSILTQSSQEANLLAIPAGMNPVKAFLTQHFHSQESLNKLGQGVLLMGLSGSLSPNYEVGEGIIYQGCGYLDSDEQWNYLTCNSRLKQTLMTQFDLKLVKGMSSDRLISKREEKQQLGKIYSVEAIDMESFAVLSFFQEKGIPVAILRVISDDCQQNLPDLGEVFNSQGELKPFYLALKMAQNPKDSLRLIQSSLIALKALKRLTQAMLKANSG